MEASTQRLIDPAELRRLQLRSDLRGLLRFAGHLAAIGGSAFLYTQALHSAHLSLALLGALGYGFTLVTMFAAMHESVHRTAFKSLWLNNAVGWFAGLLSFYNSTFYRFYHGWHHRFTQIPGQDPELDDKKPTNMLGYLLELSGATWWIGKLRTHFKLALAKSRGFGFLDAKNTPGVVRSVRWQLLVYAAAIAASIALLRPYFVIYWFLPVLLAQPLLRAILLAEHTGCSQDDNALSNTRTTYTIWPVRYLMWQMPYHAEHHRHPALPFYSLQSAHVSIGPHLSHVARRGYLVLHLELIKALRKAASARVPA